MKDVNYQLDECPVQKTLNLFQGKWNLRIIYELSKHESMRFGELKKAIPDISNTVLTSTLKALENQGLVLRQQFNEVPPHVEYSLTEIGREFQPVIESIRDWGNKYILMAQQMAAEMPLAEQDHV